MPEHEADIELKCAKCRWAKVCGPKQVVQWLRAAGKLRSNTEATVAEMHEIVRAIAPRQACPECGGVGLSVVEVTDDEQDWPGTVRCEVCQQPISTERLEIFPDTKRCAVCTRATEQGLAAGEEEYCPRCGSVMTLRPSRGSGITRNLWVCSAGCR